MSSSETVNYQPRERDEELWIGRAGRLLEEALSLIDGEDVLPLVSAADAALRIAYGELPESEMDEYPFPGEPEPERFSCICPPELLARDGFKGGCPVHAYH